MVLLKSSEHPSVGTFVLTGEKPGSNVVVLWRHGRSRLSKDNCGSNKASQTNGNAYYQCHLEGARKGSLLEHVIYKK